MLLFFLSVNKSAMNKEVQFSVARFSTQCYNLLFGSSGQVFLSHLSRNEIKPFLTWVSGKKSTHEKSLCNLLGATETYQCMNYYIVDILMKLQERSDSDI
jgi:hypothetical protein